MNHSQHLDGIRPQAGQSFIARERATGREAWNNPCTCTKHDVNVVHALDASGFERVFDRSVWGFWPVKPVHEIVMEDISHGRIGN